MQPLKSRVQTETRCKWENVGSSRCEKSEQRLQNVLLILCCPTLGNRSIDLIIFDLDGTLVDSERAICETFNHVLAQKRFPLADDAVVSRMIGQPLREMYATCVPHATTEEIEELFDMYVRAYGAFSRQHTRLLPGVATFLPLLSATKTISLATTKTRAPAIDVLTDVGLYHYFDLVLGVDDVLFPKPHPEIVQKALTTFEVDPH